MNAAGCTAFDRGGRRVRTATAARLVPRHPLLLAAYFGYRPCLPSISNPAPAPKLSTAARLVEHAWNQKLSSLGLTHAGDIALDVLAANGPMMQATLAEIVRVQAQTIGKTLTRLESHGYVHRQPNPSDRRGHLVTITGAGETVRDSARNLEASVLARANVNTDTLRKELQTVVRRLAARHEAGRTILAAGSGDVLI